MFYSKIQPHLTPADTSVTEQSTGLDLWYQERHNNEISFGLHVTGVVHSEQSPFQRIDVLDTKGFGRILTLDGLMMCSDRDEFVYHEMISHVPLLCLSHPRRVLIIGGGDGGTLREVLRHECIEQVVLCEIDGRVIDAARRFFPKLASGLEHPKAHIVVGDGVDYVKKSDSHQFDVVIVDSTDPIGPGVGLFSGAFYREVKRILTPEGIVIAQCESPWETGFDLGKVYGNLKEAFAHVYSMVGSIPSYPYGFWSWGVASDKQNPSKIASHERARSIERHAHYYNSALHQAAFALPNFLRKKLAGIVENA